MKRKTWALAAISRARRVKALSMQQIKDYLAGADMGYSKAAEIHDFPGPVVDAECELEALFRLRKVQSAGLASAVRRLARVESQYRLLHLETNRRMRALLSEEQVSRYAELRGRTPAEPTNPLTMNGESR